MSPIRIQLSYCSAARPRLADRLYMYICMYSDEAPLTANTRLDFECDNVLSRMVQITTGPSKQK